MIQYAEGVAIGQTREGFPKIRFLKTFRNRIPGDVGAYPPELAADLVKKKIAEYAQDPVLNVEQKMESLTQPLSERIVVKRGRGRPRGS